MRRLLAPLVAVAALSAACNSPTPHSTSPTAPPPSPSSVNALADLPQDVAGPPGTRNFWDLDQDFSLGDGGDDQFDRAVQLYVGVPTTPPTADSLPNELGPVVPFPFDQQLAQLSFTTPVVARTTAQLSAVVAYGNVAMGKELVLAASFGVPAAGGAETPTRLSQAIDLTSAVAPLTLGWTHHGVALDGLIAATPVLDAWRVTVRDAASGNVLVPAYSSNVVASGPVVPVDVSAAAGHRVTLDFELLGSPRGYMAVDDVSILSGGNELVTNGTFETGALAPWTVTGPDLPSQVVSGQRTIGGLVVERRVYARPDQRWARFVDVFRNPGATAITTEAIYLHELGAGSEAVIQPSANGKALSSWDGSGFAPARRDLAVVHGTSSLPAVYRSSTAQGLADGSSRVWTRFPLTVAPGQIRVVVQFIVLTEARTGDTALDATAHAVLADQEASAIVGGFWPTTTYREGMTADEVAAVVNF